jgi:hypothetical protein
MFQHSGVLSNLSWQFAIRAADDGSNAIGLRLVDWPVCASTKLVRPWVP